MEAAIALILLCVIGYLLGTGADPNARDECGDTPPPGPPAAFFPPLPAGTRDLSGKAFVTDGDGVRVNGREVRLAGLDAPEWDQPAKNANGRWFNHGARVKSELIKKVGGKHVRVEGVERDRFGRLVGVAHCGGEDIGAWLVREGHAIACSGNRYKSAEQEAKAARRGMWSHAVNIDPRHWRRRAGQQN